MTFQPVLPTPLLAVLGVLIVGARLMVLRRTGAAGRSGALWWRWAGVTAAALLLLIAAVRPAIGDQQDVTRIAGGNEPNVFVVVDRSPRMLVQDGGNRSRMALARDDIEALIERHPSARFAVIGFTDRPSLLWPLSADTWSLEPVMAALQPEARPPDAAARTNVGAAANVLRYQLIGAAQQYPRAENLVFYLGAGEADPEVPQREFDLPAGAVDGGAVLDYGSDAGPDPALRTVGDQIGVPYVVRAGDAALADALPAASAGGPTPPAVAPAGGIETYWAPAAVAAILILIELYLVLREFRTRLRTVDVGR